MLAVQVDRNPANVRIHSLDVLPGEFRVELGRHQLQDRFLDLGGDWVGDGVEGVLVEDARVGVTPGLQVLV